MYTNIIQIILLSNLNIKIKKVPKYILKNIYIYIESL